MAYRKFDGEIAGKITLTLCCGDEAVLQVKSSKKRRALEIEKPSVSHVIYGLN